MFFYSQWFIFLLIFSSTNWLLYSINIIQTYLSSGNLGVKNYDWTNGFIISYMTIYISCTIIYFWTTPSFYSYTLPFLFHLFFFFYFHFIFYTWLNKRHHIIYYLPKPSVILLHPNFKILNWFILMVFCNLPLSSQRKSLFLIDTLFLSFWIPV